MLLPGCRISGSIHIHGILDVQICFIYLRILALALLGVGLCNILIVGKVRTLTEQTVIAAVGIENSMTALGSAMVHDLQFPVFVTHNRVLEIFLLLCAQGILGIRFLLGFLSPSPLMALVVRRSLVVNIDSDFLKFRQQTGRNYIERNRHITHDVLIHRSRFSIRQNTDRLQPPG